MRKVLSFVLVLTLVLGSFSMAFAATPAASDLAGKNCADAVNVLSELKVVTGYPDGTYKPENIVTRAEMATLIVKALGLNAYVTTAAKSSFTDMAGYGWAQGYVAYAESLGVLKGYPDGTFKPGQTVSYDEATTMIVRALGYTDKSLTGTWPAAYITKAKALGILDDITAGSAGANRGDVAIMLYQALDQAIGTVDADNKWTATAGDTMLDRLDAKLHNSGDAFVLKNSDANTATTNVNAYIGAYVKAYEDSDQNVMAISEVKSTFVTGKVDNTDNTKFIVDNADSTEYTIASDAADDGVLEFVNGAYTGTTYSAIASLTPGSIYTFAVDLSGKTIKSIYSVSDWSRPAADGLFTDSDKEDIAKDQKLFGKSFKLNDDQEIDTNSFALFGAKSLDDIEKDDVVYVYTDSSTNKINRVEVGKDTIEGTVTKIKAGKYTVNGVAYKPVTGANYANEDLITPSVDDSVKGKLDYSGKIYELTASGTADNYAVVLDKANYAGGLTGNDAKVKLFLADGTAKTFVANYEDINDNAIINSTTGVWDADVTSGAVVKYGLNSDGEVDAMDLVIAADATTIGGMKITDKGYYDGSKVDSGAVIFSFNGTLGSFTTDADDYSVTTLDKVLDTDVAAGMTYVDDSVVKAMMVDDDSVSNASDVYGVLNDTEENQSTDGYGVDMIVDGADKTYDADANYSANIDGKLYLVKFNLNGAVSDLKDAKANGTIDDGNFITATTGDGITVDGKVVTISDAAIGTNATTKTAIANGTQTNTAVSAKTTITLADDVVVYVWDAVNDEYTVGSVRDIEGASKVDFYDVTDNDAIYDIVVVTE